MAKVTLDIPTVEEILEEAERLIAKRLPHRWADCDAGPHCPRCAVAYATTRLGRHLPVGWTDSQLEAAVMFIRIFVPPGQVVLSKADALDIVQKALKAVDGKD